MPAFSLESIQDELLSDNAAAIEAQHQGPSYPREEGPAYPSASLPFSTGKITVEQWQKYFNEKQNERYIKISENQSSLKIYSPSIPAVYIFTKPENPAHPATEIRIFSPDMKSVTLTWIYAGNIEEFEKWRPSVKEIWPLF